MLYFTDQIRRLYIIQCFSNLWQESSAPQPQYWHQSAHLHSSTQSVGQVSTSVLRKFYIMVSKVELPIQHILWSGSDVLDVSVAWGILVNRFHRGYVVLQVLFIEFWAVLYIIVATSRNYTYIYSTARLFDFFQSARKWIIWNHAEQLSIHSPIYCS